MEEKKFPVPAEFKGKRSGVNFALVLKARNNKDDVLIPAFWRITYERKLKYIVTGYKFSKTDWDVFCARDLQKHKDIKSTLKKYLENVLRPAIDKLVETGCFSFDALNKELGKSDIVTVNDAFRAKISELEAEGRINYSESFKYTLASLEAYKKTIQFRDVTPSFLKKYEKHLIDGGKTETTVGFYMRNIRTIINNDGEPYLKDGAYPFGKGKYIIPKGEGRQLALRLDQIHLMQSYACDPSIEMYRDLWMFSFYGNGMNITDVLRLEWKDLRDGEITFIRKKTKSKRRTVVRVYVPMIRPLEEIIQKWGNKKRDGYIFPFLNGTNSEAERIPKVRDVLRLVNKSIQQVARELGLPDGISSYSTRHSFVTILEHLNVPRIYISNSLGHTNETVTDAYANMTEKELRYKYNSLLIPKTNDEIVKSLIESAKMEIIYN